MPDEAGPSGAAVQPQEASVLAEADAKFEAGLQCIKDDKLEEAVQLFAEVLEARVKHYGALAPECASAYYRYGSALLYQYQESGDVLGGPIGGAAGQDPGKENEESPEKAGSEGEEEEEGEAAADAPVAVAADEKGKGPALEPAGPEGGGGAGEGGEGVEGDLQLAWENLDLARAIWAKDAGANHEQLASAHMLLGDVAMENDAFDTAMVDFNHAVEHQSAAGFNPDDRRIAELQFKRCKALQFLDRPEEALEAVQVAVQVLRARQSNLAAAARGEEPAPARAAEAADVAALLEDLNAMVEELQGVVDEVAATRVAVRSAMEQLATMQAAGAAAGAGAVGDEQQQGFDRSTVVSPVKDLGVVGRGRKRINLAPVGPAAEGATAPAAAGADASAAKKKRSLEDLMGGAVGGDAAVGFGATHDAAGSGSGQAAAPAVPAFLQVYKAAAEGGKKAAEQA